MKYWVNYGYEVYCKSETIPCPLLYATANGIKAVDWTEISEQDFNESMQELIDIEKEAREDEAEARFRYSFNRKKYSKDIY